MGADPALKHASVEKVDVQEGTVAVRGPGVKGSRFVKANQRVELSPTKLVMEDAVAALDDLPVAEPDEADEAASAAGARSNGFL